ncbi:exodeoxyribonuclease III [Streptomyces radicis]|uniref:exodeoxyribonuclease III n=1 Tax=Streptomyces radicis TaxID=1750517 RepID=UPI0015FF7E82|nr:exodeoxyribonuclease III [Streptomyces radicis]
MLTVTTVNVNGLRAASRKGYLKWLATSRADVVCLQEVRAEEHQLPDDVRVPEGWHAVYAPADTPGRAGVAVLTRRAPEAVRVGFGAPEFAKAGRYLEVDLPGVTIGSLYLPTGEAGTPKQEMKERFMAAFFAYLAELRGKAAADGREALVCGDWNIAHREADIKNWRGNRDKSGFLPEERAWLGRVLAPEDGGWTDVVRALHPDREGPYSWWTYRGRAFDNDTGWRIDMLMATRGLAGRATEAFVERAASHDERWSDHAPVTAAFTGW